MKDNVVPKAVCPGCMKVNDLATCMFTPGAIPKAGDFTICIGCSAVLRFDHALRPRLLTLDDRLVLVNDKRLWSEVQQVQYVMAITKRSA